MTFLTNEFKGKSIITKDGVSASVICNSRYGDIIIRVNEKVRCVKSGDYSVTNT